MGIINTGTNGSVNFAGDKLTLTLAGTDGSEVSLVLEGTRDTLTTGGSGNTGASGEVLVVESAGKGIKFASPIPTSPVALRIDKQDEFYPLWEGSPIQVFQWSEPPNSDRDGAHWRGNFDPSDKQYLLLNPSSEQPWFTFTTRSWDTGDWDTARVELKEGRKLFFWDFEEPAEAWLYEENATPSPSPSPTPSPGDGGGGFDPTDPGEQVTYQTGWAPKDKWVIQWTENPEPWNDFGSKTWGNVALAALFDSDNNTSFEAFNRHSFGTHRITIDFGEEYKNISKIYINTSDDVTKKSKGKILTTPDMPFGVQVHDSGTDNYLDGEIALSSTNGRFMMIVFPQNYNLGRSGKLEIKEITVYADYPTATPSPAPTPAPTPVPTTSPTALEALNSIVWLKGGNLSNFGSAGGTFANSGMGIHSLNGINTFAFGDNRSMSISADFGGATVVSGIALMKLYSGGIFHGIIDFLGVTFEVQPQSKASILRRDNSVRTNDDPNVSASTTESWQLMGWEVDFTNQQCRFYSGGSTSIYIPFSIPQNNGSNSIVIGFYPPNGGGYFHGEMAELLIFPSPLPSDLSAIKSELNSKWGTTL